MWGCDLTPLYDETGSRLMSFTAFLPLGMQIGSLPRPTDVPTADADLVVVQEVREGMKVPFIGSLYPVTGLLAAFWEWRLLKMSYIRHENN